MKLLLTGGLGYIGSHTALELLRKGYDICIIDNLSNSESFILDRLEQISGKGIQFIEMDICRQKDFLKLADYHFDSIIHFAAKKSVPESIQHPNLYYQNNLVGLINLMQFAEDRGIHKIVFSSSCTVYGKPLQIPVSEGELTKLSDSPYGNTKKWAEEILQEYARLKVSMRIVLLRYFNPVGADQSGLMGELPRGIPSNLMPYITQTAAGLRDYLRIYGNDYSTSDGTAIRDYIHVSDLAAAHISALEYAEKMIHGSEIFNIGTGNGYSVLEMIETFQEINRVKLDYRFAPRRDGDLEQIWADPSKALVELNWKAKYTLNDMVSSAWSWQQNLMQEKF